MNWFIPTFEDFQTQRAILNLRLGRSIRYYRELIVPGIGGVWFLRQLSWACAGLHYAENHPYKPAKIANAIEALGCKLEWKHVDRDVYQKKGRQAFNRDEHVSIWRFTELTEPINYVQVTYRQSTVRALWGLNLAPGTRYNSMALTDLGRDLNDAFLSQRGLKEDLASWLNGSTISQTRNMAEKITTIPTDKEKTIIQHCLCEHTSDKLGHSGRRKSLIEAFGRNTTNPPDIETIKKSLLRSGRDNIQQDIDNLDTAVAFDEMMQHGRELVHICASIIADNPNAKAGQLMEDKGVKQALGALCRDAHQFNSSKGEREELAKTFANEILSLEADNSELLKTIIGRDGNILAVSGDRIIAGPLFDRRKDINLKDVDTADNSGIEDSSTANKIRQLFELWGDCT